MKRFLIVLDAMLAMMYVCAGSLAEEASIYHVVPFPDMQSSSGYAMRGSA